MRKMISISQKKLINQLKQKKYRSLHRLFIVEGVKCVSELMMSELNVRFIFCTEKWLSENKHAINKGTECVLINEAELMQISDLQTPNQVLAVAEMPSYPENFDFIETEKVLALDNIKDPGNLGTIIRTANWFGFEKIICSTECVDLYNTKTIQATMGSFAKVRVFTCDLKTFLSKYSAKVPVYGAVLDGNTISAGTFKKNGILVIGSESHGISKGNIPFLTDKIKIDNFSEIDKNQLSESLNAAVACGILLYEFAKAN